MSFEKSLHRRLSGNNRDLIDFNNISPRVEGSNSTSTLSNGVRSITQRLMCNTRVSFAILLASTTSMISNTAFAADVVFSTPAQSSTWIVPADVTEIKITARGAAGGPRANRSGAQFLGGGGATVEGVYSVTPGDTIYFVVGERGAPGDIDAGGGGSTGVFINSDLVIVAGGGGGYDNTQNDPSDVQALAQESGGDSPVANNCILVPGGTGGQGGDGGGYNATGGNCVTSPTGGGGGGGIFSAGEQSFSGLSEGIENGGSAADLNPLDGLSVANGGPATSDGAVGGRGFTGGGGSDRGYAGGGGGYSGGAGANPISSFSGGGGSFIASAISGTDVKADGGVGDHGDGSILIEYSMITIEKTVINDDVGTSNSADFTLRLSSSQGDTTTATARATGDVIQIISGGTSNSYTLSEDAVAGYIETANSCNPLIHTSSDIGTDYTCTITNDDLPIVNPQNDDFTSSPIVAANGGTTLSVFANDMLNNSNFTSGDVNVSLTDIDGLTGAIINADGTINIPANSTPGTYLVEYEICDSVDSTVCETATATIVVFAPQVDLSLTKTNTPGVNGEIDQANDTLTSGQTTTYTLVITNNGPDSVSGAVVTDTPSGDLTCPATNTVTLSGDGVPAGTFTIADLTGAGISLDNLDDGQSTTLTYSCEVN